MEQEDTKEEAKPESDAEEVEAAKGKERNGSKIDEQDPDPKKSARGGGGGGPAGLGFSIASIMGFNKGEGEEGEPTAPKKLWRPQPVFRYMPKNF